MKCRASICFLALVLPLTTTRTARASVFRALGLKRLAADAAMVALGRVERTQAQWRGRKIETKVTMDVSEVWKGRTTVRRLSFWTLGGTVGRYTMRVLGAPSFRPGDRILVFLAARRGRLFVRGMVQGCFHIVGQGLGARAVRHLGHVTWLGHAPKPSYGLAELRRLVRSLAKRASGGRP